MKITEEQWEFIKEEANNIKHGEIRLISVGGGEKTDVLITSRTRLKKE